MLSSEGQIPGGKTVVLLLPINHDNHIIIVTQFSKIVARSTVYNKISYKDTEYSIVISLTLLKATNRLK